MPPTEADLPPPNRLFDGGMNDFYLKSRQRVERLGLADAEEILRDVGDRRRELVERAVADEICEVNPIGSREVRILLHGIAQAVGRRKIEDKVASRDLR